MPNETDIEKGAENPAQFTGIKKSRIMKSAAGVKAVASSVKMIYGEVGVTRGFKALMNLNQEDGFDCPSCAWPDPDDERSGLGEYCENGARAVAEEATTKKLTPAFFANHSVNELASLPTSEDHEFSIASRSLTSISHALQYTRRRYCGQYKSR